MKTDIHVMYFESRDVFDNLALEETLLVERSDADIVIAFYQNLDSVVIGRHQNPWIECDIDAIHADGVALARRVSGGGAVYHDSGNLNYSVVIGRDRYDRDTIFDAVLSGLANIGVTAQRNERNDILVDGAKISGTAFRHTRESTLHHGTLLIDSRLDRIERYLHNRRRSKRIKGIQSVESRVGRLGNGVTPVAARDALARALFRALAERSPDALPTTALPPRSQYQDRRNELATWSWVYGSTPDFALELPYAIADRPVTLLVHRGCATSLSIPGTDQPLPVPAWRYGHDALDATQLQSTLIAQLPQLGTVAIHQLAAAAVEAWSKEPL